MCLCVRVCVCVCVCVCVLPNVGRGNIEKNVETLKKMLKLMKKLSPRDREFRWYKYDQEGPKRGETWFL